jgi:hypothetical protein
MSSPAAVGTATLRRLSWLFRAVAIALGALHAAVAMRSQSMNEDGIAYLDFGDALWTEGVAGAVNTTWSPLYAWIVAGVVRATGPSMDWEFPTVQVVNFGIYLIALACFEYFWRRLGAMGPATTSEGRDRACIPTFWWLAAGYSLFVYVSLNLISIWSVTPDMCVAALVYLAAGLLIELTAGARRGSTAIGLGCVLGVAYLAKAAMFPLGLACIGLVTLLPKPDRRGLLRATFALVAFLFVATPWMIRVSEVAGRPTFSDVSRFTYLKHVNQMPWPQWQEAADSLQGSPLHPPRRIYDSPAVWEFATPIRSTYPLGYDPAWWTQGLEPTLDLRSQLTVLAENLQYYFQLFVRMQGGVLASTALLLLLTLAYQRRVRWDISTALALWACGAFGLYGLVFAEARYVAPFVLLLWAGLLSAVGLSPGAADRRIASAAMTVLTLFVWINIGALNLQGLAGLAGFESAPREMAASVQGRSLANQDTARHPLIGFELRDAGLTVDDPIAFVGYSYSAFWARLARLRIVAEIRPEEAAEFWALDLDRRGEVLAVLQRAGARAVVAEPPSSPADATGWTVLPVSRYLLMRLD